MFEHRVTKFKKKEKRQFQNRIYKSVIFRLLDEGRYIERRQKRSFLHLEFI